MKEFIRRINYSVVTFISILGFSLSAEIIKEDDWADKIDDILLLLLGIGAIVWYKKKGYDSTNRWISVIIIAIGLLTKIGAIVIEHADKEAVGDDIAITTALSLAFLFMVSQVLSHKKHEK